MKHQILQRLEELPLLFRRRADLQRRASGMQAVFLLEAAGNGCRISVADGTIASDIASGPMKTWDFALRASEEAWLEHWQPLPRPGFHDIFALARAGQMRIEGNLVPLMRHLQLVKDLVALPRGSM